jgi:hypothetical protein
MLFAQAPSFRSTYVSSSVANDNSQLNRLTQDYCTSLVDEQIVHAQPVTLSISRRLQTHAPSRLFQEVIFSGDGVPRIHRNSEGPNRVTWFRGTVRCEQPEIDNTPPSGVVMTDVIVKENFERVRTAFHSENFAG